MKDLERCENQDFSLQPLGRRERVRCGEFTALGLLVPKYVLFWDKGKREKARGQGVKLRRKGVSKR